MGLELKKLGNRKIQKKAIIITLSILIALCGVAAGIVIHRVREAAIAAKLNKANVTWYSVDQETFTITTTQELYDLAVISDFYNFEGQTILLGADIVVNEGNAADWSENAPEKLWFPIQGFAGTFDGQGHTISGLYGAGIGNPMGLFSDTHSKSNIKDFRLVNSYFSSSGTQGVGAITSNGCGNFEKIYTDAIVVTNRYYAGGVIGRVDSGKESSVIARPTRISNCWFDGEIRLTSGAARMGGGLIGGIAIGNVRIEHCLGSGVVNCSVEKEAYSAGGLIGSVGVYRGTNNNIMLSMEDCLQSGEVNTSYKTATGSVMGLIYKGANVNVKNSYTVKGNLNPTDSVSGSMVGDALGLKKSWLIGQEAYRWTELDFNQYWSAIADKTPELKYFSKETPMNLDGVKKAYNFDWYDEEAKDYIIDSVEDLYGLAMLCNQNVTFESKRIKLANDIVVNEGNATDWAKGENIPDLDWIPIGGGGNKHRPFSGTFDGQGHTISGLYMKSDDYYMGFFGVLNMKGLSTIKNFKLTNSYFECTRTENLGSEVDGLGGIAGQGAGTLDTVYCDAILVSGTRNTGGLIGNQRQKDSPLKITNCWYNGEITGTQWIGGIVGFVYNGVKETVISDCLVTANLTSTMEKDTDASYVGGIAGRIATGEIKSCLTMGTFTGKKVVYGIIGRNTVRKGQKVTIEKCYSTAEVKALYENGSGGETIAITSSKITEDQLKGTAGYVNTLMNFYVAGVKEDGKWIAVNNKVPQLKSFSTDKAINVKGIVRAYTDYDISWYDSSKDTYIIKTADQLYGVAALNNGDIGTTFRNKTIKLGADIQVNKGNATDWAKGVKTPAYTWTPIGGGDDSKNHRPFRGTFDGQGHTISGIYLKSEGYYLGLFGVLASDGTSTVKNLKLTNSYFECTRTESLPSQLEGLGSIAGQGAGTLHTIYSNAILVNSEKQTGGLVGNQRQKDAPLTVTNCWFDGSITGTQWIGGILGFADSGVGKTNLTDCLVTAEMVSTTNEKHSYMGGLAGRVINGKFDSCAVTGTLNGVGLVRGLVGMTVTKEEGGFELTKCYNATNIAELYNTALKQPVSSQVKAMNVEELKGTKAYANTLLSFYDKNNNKAGRWALIDNQTPELKSFSKAKYMSDLASLNGVERPMVADTSWYDASKIVFTIKTVEQLYGLAELCNSGTNFAEKTVKLGADIQVNKGNATDWAAGVKLPTREWIPIGGGADSKVHVSFAGTFDGQGYTISGLYMKSDGYYLGLFGVLAADGSSTIKNLKLTNSYFESTRTDSLASELEGLGSIAGQGAGTLDTIYSDVILVNRTRNTGGFVGNLRQAKAPLEVVNCWYDGKITGTQWIGGILGFVDAGTAYANITDCLVTADMTATTTEKHSYLGGLAARATTGTFASCVVIGELTGPGLVRGLVGMSVTKPTQELVLVKCYNATNVESHYNTALEQPVTSQIKYLKADALKGTQGYINTLLDFYDKNNNATGRWALVENKLPELKSFAKADYVADLSVFSDLVRPVVADRSWYSDTTKDEYTISTTGELYGLAELVNEGNSFAGKTIKLGTDIKVNVGYATDWAEGKNVPNNMWTPIGGGANSTDNVPFAGTFDGQGYTISGIYMKSSGLYLGLFGVLAADGSSTVKNLQLINSYFECTRTTANGNSLDGLGSIVGQGAGTLDTIYSDAIVVNKTNNTGGLVGNQRQANSTLNVKNCWFDGQVTGYRFVGGVLGYAYNATCTTNVENCLVTANITATWPTDNNACVGGIAGSAYVGEFKSCIVEGKLTGTSAVGAFIGRCYAPSVTSIKLTKCYNATDCSTYYTNKEITLTNVATLTQQQLFGENAYINTLLDFYDKNENADAKWVIVKNRLPELRSFAKNAYVEDLGELGDLARPIVPDRSWYQDTTKDEYIIYKADELYGLAELVNEGNSFAGKTIKLGADIRVNNGKATDWAEGNNLPNNLWTPIGGGTDSSTNIPFAGTFDGQGHTISGVYMKSNGLYLGFFGVLSKDGSSVIKNFKLTNSYFESTATTVNANNLDGLGSIAGQGAGTLDTIYSDAILVTAVKRVGGFVGNQRQDNSVLIVKNCWFDGSASASQFVGGILGYANGATCTTKVENCLVTAELTGTYNGNACVGGITGSAYAGAFDSCVVAGKLTGKAAVAAFIGRSYVTSATNLTMVKCYNASNVSEYYTNKAITLSNVDTITKEQLTGTSAYTNTLLDFYVKNNNENGKWVAVQNDLLTLKSFADESKIADVSTLKRTITADTSWYDSSKSVFVISSANELYGLAKLCNDGTTFASKTIKLGSDIKVNDGLATDWAEGKNLPDTAWTPIGGGANNANRVFAGTFDGQGHTISGLYMKSNGNYLGLFGLTASNGSTVIQNLKLTNTYFENTGTGTGTSIGLGSIAGQGAGKFDSIYSDAILKSTAYNTGGLVGSHRYVTVTINNCVYKGNITGNSYVGGILGYGYKTVTKADIQNCLVVADCSATGNGVGGICGGIYTANIASCVFAGNVNTSGYRAGIVGRIYAESGKTVDINKCYYHSNKDSVYTVSGTATVSVKNVKYFADKAQLTGTNAYANTLLDFYDQSTNSNGKWVLVTDSLPELRSFITKSYMVDLSSLSGVKRPTEEK